MFPTQYIDDHVKDARDVPGEVALQAGGKGVRRELSLIVQSNCETKGGLRKTRQQ